MNTRYDGFKPATVRKMMAACAAAGDDFTLQFRTVWGDATGVPSLEWRVVAGGKALAGDDPWANESFPCPPICP